jgi:flavodoxin
VRGGGGQMKIGIVVYSQTGHTYEVANMLKEKLEAVGKTAEVERITAAGAAVGQYDTLIFGAPVHAFSLAEAMADYLNNLSSLQGKKVFCFVTKLLPFHWTGGNRAVRQMKKILQAKGAAVIGTDIVIWSEKQREQSIKSFIEKVTALV